MRFGRPLPLTLSSHLFPILDLWLLKARFRLGGSPGNVVVQFFISSGDKNSSALPLPYKVLGTFERSEFQECIFNCREG